MKKTVVAILILLAAICVGAVFYLLFSTPAVGAALTRALIPAILGAICGAAIGRLTGPAQVSPQFRRQTI